MYLERWLDIVYLRPRSLLRRGAVDKEMDRELPSISIGKSKRTSASASLEFPPETHSTWPPPWRPWQRGAIGSTLPAERPLSPHHHRLS